MSVPEFSDSSVCDVLARDYGLQGELHALVSERDQNRVLTTAAGDRFVIKVASPDESPQTADFQARALQWLATRRLRVAVPQLVPTTGGAPLASIGNGPDRRILRVVTFVAGRTLPRERIDVRIAGSLGRQLAALDVALQGFSHAAESHGTLWDMQRALKLRTRAAAIGDVGLRERALQVLERFEREALPAFATLRRQVIHNDANPENVMVDDNARRVTGFIDFGDLLAAPLIVEIAICASYLRHAAEPFAYIRPFVQAYDSVTSLSTEELDLLPLLIEVRLVTTIVMQHWRLAHLPADDAYRQKSLASEAGAEAFLSALQSWTASQKRSVFL